MKSLSSSFLTFTLFLFFYSCGGGSTPAPDFGESTEEEDKVEFTLKVEDIEDPLAFKGVGPISSIELTDEVDEMLAEKGLEVFNTNCIACHKMDTRLVGPALADVTERRSPEWILNMILNPEVMIEEDTLAMALYAEYGSPMNNQNLTESDARAILEYFRSDLE